MDESRILLALIQRNELIDNHSRRVSLLSTLIGQAMRLSDDELRTLQLGAFLHDIGKLSISQRVLEKPGPLDEQEFEELKAHPLVGGNFVEALGYPPNVVQMIKYHHERLDGSGYPFGLKDKEIPLTSRIIAVADVYEAMTAKRSYREAMTVQEAFAELSQPNKYDQSVVHMLRTILGTIDWPEFHGLPRQSDLFILSSKNSDN